MDRRHFLGSMIAVSGLVLTDNLNLIGASPSPRASRRKSGKDDIVVFISDLHNNPDGYQPEKLKQVVDSILSMKPRPREVIAFGDIAYLTGKDREYKKAKEMLQPIEDAGIGLTIGMGNHDRRENFRNVFPKQAAMTKVPGRYVSIVEGIYADIIMLDSLNQGDDESTWITPGTMDAEQKAWLEKTLSEYGKPVFVCSHHPIHELGIQKILLQCPWCAGYIHGHDHIWKTDFIRLNYSDTRIITTLCLPSTGHWGDIGYTVFRMQPDKAVAELVQTDFFFPKPVSGSERPTMWDDMVKDHEGLRCTFRYPVK